MIQPREALSVALGIAGFRGSGGRNGSWPLFRIESVVRKQKRLKFAETAKNRKVAEKVAEARIAVD
jgi:hypothetical protein